MRVAELALYSGDGDLWWCGVELSGELVTLLLTTDMTYASHCNLSIAKLCLGKELILDPSFNNSKG